jgi:hypothetical protein
LASEKSTQTQIRVQPIAFAHHHSMVETIRVPLLQT